MRESGEFSSYILRGFQFPNRNRKSRVFDICLQNKLLNRFLISILCRENIGAKILICFAPKIANAHVFEFQRAKNRRHGFVFQRSIIGPVNLN